MTELQTTNRRPTSRVKALTGQEPSLQSDEAARLARALLEQARARLGRNQAG